jgi:hypothetical protein
MRAIGEESLRRLGALERELRVLKRTQEHHGNRIEALECTPGEAGDEHEGERSTSRGFLLFSLVTALMFLAWCTQGPLVL